MRGGSVSRLLRSMILNNDILPGFLKIVLNHLPGHLLERR
jgi:hypothetical protein